MPAAPIESSPDHDRGWAFVIMACGFLSEVLTFGLTYTTAILYIIFLDEFEESPALTAWAVNLNVFCCFLAGPLANAFLLSLGSRATAIIACTLSTIGLFCCSFANSIYVIIAMYGVFCGVGYICCFLATFNMITRYFIKYRVLAMAVGTVGSGAGQFIFPPLIRALIDAYHWRGAFIVLAGINLNMLVISACLMPPRMNYVVVNKPESTTLVQKLKRSILESFGDLSIFKNINWICLCLAFLIFCLGITGFQTHISNYGRVSGLSVFHQTLMPSVVGIGSIIGRFSAACFVNLLKFHPVLMYVLAYLLIVVACIVVSLANNVAALYICSLIAGLSFSTFSNYLETTIFTVGVKQFSTGLSYSLLFGALGSLCGGTLAAWIYELDPSYLWSFRVVGLIVLFGDLLSLPALLTIQNRKVKLKISFDDRRAALAHEIDMDKL